VAANTLALLDRLGLEGEVTIAERGGSLLAEAPKKAREQIFGFLTAKGPRVLTNTPVTSFSSGAAWTRDGHEIPCDVPVLATGISPPGVFRASSLTTGQDGGLWVDQNLRSVNHRCLFGGGDCISYRREALPKLGVFAVRQGPVLFHNLQAALEGEPLKPYKPQKRFLYILNLGDGTGLAVYGSLVWRGRLSFMLKHRIDEKFVSRYRR
jgi:NADH dehydrogenase FAD-containing subunit